MTQVAEQSRTRRRECDTQDYDLKVSSYDQVASMLIALLVLVGAVVLLLFLLWLTSTLFAKQTAIPVTLAEVSGGQGGVSTEGLQLDAPEAEEMAQELEIEEPQIEETLANVVDAIAQRLADLTDPTLTEDMESGGPTASTGTGDAPSFGEGGGPGGISRAERWEVFFEEGGGMQSYARQLDFFGIELAVLGGTERVTYAFNLAKSTPDRRSASGDEETRLYMSWRSGKLREADDTLLDKAGINSRGLLAVQFYPPEIENRLAQLEQQFAGLAAEDIRKTRFGVRPSGEGYEFYVMEQIPR